jgi:dynein heavy chain
MNKQGIFSIEISKNYGEKKWHEDLASMLTECGGVNNKQIVFMFSDSHIIFESFLEDVNNILNSGEVPNLFAKDEQDDIISNLRPEGKKVN